MNDISKKLDYVAVLADLEAQEADLERELETIRAGVAAIRTLMYRCQSNGGSPAPRQFAGMGLREAIRIYLRQVAKAQTTRQVVDALLRGGFETTAKNFSNSTYMALLRDKQVVKKGKKWALRPEPYVVPLSDAAE